MIVHKIFDYHGEHLFPVLCKANRSSDQRRIFTRFPSEQRIYPFGAKRRREESHSGSAKRQADRFRHSPSDTSYVRVEIFCWEDRSTHLWRRQCRHSPATHAKRHVKRVMENWRIRKDMAKTVPELSDREKHVASVKKPNQGSHVQAETPENTGTDPKYPLPAQTVVNIATYTHPIHRTEITTLTLTNRRNNRLAILVGRSSICVVPRSVRIYSVHTAHHVPRRPSCLIQTTSHRNSRLGCWSW